MWFRGIEITKGDIFFKVIRQNIVNKLKLNEKTLKYIAQFTMVLFSIILFFHDRSDISVNNINHKNLFDFIDEMRFKVINQ